MSSLLKGHQVMKIKADKSELDLKNKNAELKKTHLDMVNMEETLKTKW